jgi:hypothetical protein
MTEKLTQEEIDRALKSAMTKKSARPSKKKGRNMDNKKSKNSRQNPNSGISFDRSAFGLVERTKRRKMI